MSYGAIKAPVVEKVVGKNISYIKGFTLENSYFLKIKYFIPRKLKL